MTTVLQDTRDVEVEDEGPDPARWAEICELTRDERPARAAYNPAAHWFERQVAAHRERARADRHGLQDLIITALSDVRISLVQLGAKTAHELVATGREPYKGIVLSKVGLPEAHRTTDLADVLDDEASYYLTLDTDLGRLAAWAILGHAAGVEHHGSRTVREYLDAEDHDAAAAAAYDATFGGPDNPTW